ncbi:MAG: GPR1/FUN34/YaaH family transporter, partial [Deltaproteobacteria bacterium]|nr:GPR1/FUN34/YaaH family transporter [Deltaproteobacteria bacterium]
LLWAIFGFATFFGANVLKKWVMLQIALFLTSVFLLIQAIGLFTGSLAGLLPVVGIVGIVAGLCALYTAIAVLINVAAEKTILPA